MSIPKYPAYKASGGERLGNLPAHWAVVRLKNVLLQRITDGPHTTPSFKDHGIPFLSVDGIQHGELRFDGCRFISASDHEEYRRKALPRRDDLLMGKAASTGKIARVKVDFEFSIWSPLALIRVDQAKTLPAFVEYALKCPIAQAQIDDLCTSNTQKNISMDDIPQLMFARPPLSEQVTITTFLDHESAKIDALVEEQKRLIELLNEKRQAVISQAVTKGLDPNVPMKDSGVEWLGEVPAHWAVKRLKHISPQVTVGIVVEPSKHYAETGVPALRSLNVRQDSIDPEGMVYITPEGHSLHSKSRLNEGDLVAVRSGQPGTTAVVPANLDGCNCIDLLVIRQPITGCSEFLSRFMNSDAARIQYTHGSGGAIQQHFNVEAAGNLVLAWPPHKEQMSIAAAVTRQLKEFDGLIDDAAMAVSLLGDRRSALISAAVTGKIDVRGLAPQPEGATA